MSKWTFNRLLESAGMPLADTRLVRHQDNRAPSGRTPFDLWYAEDGSFERYQAIQSRKVFDAGQCLASFVATPSGETLFVGMYRVRGSGVVADGGIDPLHGHDVSGLHEYRIEKTSALEDYAGRLIVEWGEGYRSWVQRADRRDKDVLELRREKFGDLSFPGFNEVDWNIREIGRLPYAWRQVLGTTSGVYLLVSMKTGRQYVGSAVGAGGFLARWMAYSANGHGGNAGLRLAAERDYQVSVLEVAASTATKDEIVKLESNWKDKLLSRRFGFNRN